MALLCLSFEGLPPLQCECCATRAQAPFNLHTGGWLGLYDGHRPSTAAATSKTLLEADFAIHEE